MPKGEPDKDGEIPGTLTMFGVVLGIVSTVLGGGIVAIPYSFYSVGISLGMVISIFSSFQVVIGCLLYLKAREACPNKPSSMFEIGFLT